MIPKFPIETGETEKEFEATCAFLEKIRFYEIHVFRYSRRNGTAAAKMPNQVPESVKALRSDRLLAMTAAQAADFRRQFAGEEETILLEEICGHNGRKYWTGSTARYVTGAVPVGELQQGDCGRALDPESKNLSGALVTGFFCGEVIPFSRGDAMLFRVGKKDGSET